MMGWSEPDLRETKQYWDQPMNAQCPRSNNIYSYLEKLMIQAVISKKSAIERLVRNTLLFPHGTLSHNLARNCFRRK